MTGKAQEGDAVRPGTVRGRVAGSALVLALLAAGAAGCGSFGGHRPAAAGPAADSYAKAGVADHTVEVSPSACGRGWTDPRPGLQLFTAHNSDANPEDLYLERASDAAVLGELEGLGPGASAVLSVRLPAGSYRFRCLPADADAVLGPVVKVPGTSGDGTAGSAPAVAPVTQQDLIAPTLAYQHWVASRLPLLLRQVTALQSAIDSGDLAGARAAWLPAHLGYERLGAAYGAFGALDSAIDGTAAGLPKGTSDSGFTGFHRIEYGLWHGQPAAGLRGAAARLVADVRQLQRHWATTRMDPQVLGVRAHEITENTIRFELTGRTDYGSHSNLATARANLDGTAEALAVLKPVLSTRMAAELPGIEAALARARAALPSGNTAASTALSDLTQRQRESLNAAFGDLVERLAAVAAVCDIRRTT
ncbi:EfeM/EfeO family lipoprotein [Phaeacidiphilus oryzae]|uniref:EfeM/EfeO family lipoprotein n=1 Tax=Phaeacidiphilus oryzae TaxID=348818 RepID=UPI0005645EEC|nr:EfeM/EfeO family lipoprotein [Phaeacidiphilus oryzae]